ncbi:MAG: nucleotidyltransferase domain-containing protein [Pyrinomonadaceae bacterium]
MTSPSLQKKRAIASSVASSLFKDQKVLAVLLIGSVARGLASDDSDIDLAALFEEYTGAVVSKCDIDGELVGIERHSSRAFLSWPSIPLLDQHELREAGRFANSIVLCSRWKSLNLMKAKSKRAMLHPRSAFNHFSLVESNLKIASPNCTVSPEERLWALQGAAAGLALLLLSLSPFKFQKPKWTIADLRNSDDKTLLPILGEVFSARTHDATSCVAKLEVVRKALVHACTILRLPSLKRTEEPNDEYDYMRWAFRDAESLLRDGDFLGSIFTAVHSLRLMYVLLRQFFSHSPVAKRTAPWLQWRNEALRSILPAYLFEGPYCETRWLSLVEVGSLIQQEYKDRYRELTRII